MGWLHIAFVGGCALGLAGCLETVAPESVGPAVAVVSLEGGTEAARAAFRGGLEAELTARKVAAAGADKAQYLLRIYLGDGDKPEFIADVYGADQARRTRLTGAAAGDCAEALAAFLSP